MEQVIFRDLGRVEYQKAWDYQSELHRAVVDRKLRNRDSAERPEPRRHYLLFCEHPPVYTLGKSGSLAHLLLSETELRQRGIAFHKINRGGDITYHGPGQVVGYPIFDLDGFFTDVHRYVRYLEEVIIRTLAEYGLHGQRIEGYTGVWLPAEGSRPHRKICAIGVHLSRWVTMHGFAFNVATDLEYFEHIVPCGIDEADKEVTSLSRELGRAIAPADVQPALKRHFAELFSFAFQEDPENFA